MFRHADLMHMYTVAVAAGLLVVLATIGLLTDLLGMRQISTIAILLVLAILISLVYDRLRHRGTRAS
jgi:hypothetical protein